MDAIFDAGPQHQDVAFAGRQQVHTGDKSLEQIFRMARWRQRGRRPLALHFEREQDGRPQLRQTGGREVRDLGRAFGRQRGDVLDTGQAGIVEDAAGALAKAQIGQVFAFDVDSILARELARLLERGRFGAQRLDQARGRAHTPWPVRRRAMDRSELAAQQPLQLDLELTH